MRATINDKPVIVISTPGPYGLAPVDQNFLDDLRKEFVKNFGKSPHIMLDESWKTLKLSVPDAAYNYFTSGASLAGLTRNDDTYCAGPGYDDRGLPGRKGVVIPRDEDGIKGFRYAKAWQEIIKRNAVTACIETWNNHPEGSEIEPTLEFGYFYSALTKHHINLWERLVNDAKLINHTAPATMTPGEIAEVKVTMENTGTTEWSPNIYKLGSQAQDNVKTWGFGRAELGENDFVQPGQRIELKFKIKAPEEPGLHALKLQMLLEYAQWFGSILEHKIEVKKRP
jgi:hypothetical protein